MTNKEAVLAMLSLVSRGVKIHLTPEGIEYLRQQTKEAQKS